MSTTPFPRSEHHSLADLPFNADVLETIDAPEALDWAKRWSHATESALDFSDLQQRMRSALNVDTKIPYVLRRGSYLYNFWQDADHPRGLWRRTTLDAFLSGTEEWQTLIDVDKLAHEENESWVWKGAHVRPHHFDRALVQLSRGGADAVEIREFDLCANDFVTADPFHIPEAKTRVSWVDRDTLLIGTDLGPGTLTDSGYPARAYTWQRGTPLQSAKEFFAGKTSDLAVSAWADSTPGFERKFIRRALDFYRSHTFIERDEALQIVEVPEDCELAFHRQWMFVFPREDYAGVPAGGVGAIVFQRFLDGDRDFRRVFTPTPTTSIQDISFTKTRIILTVLDNVSSRLEVLRLDSLEPEDATIQLPPLTTAHVVATCDDSDEVWLGASSFTQPDTLFRVDVNDSLIPVEVRHAPALFNAHGMETRQHWAISADGTKIPYFIVGDFSQGPRPTLVGGYGGFEVSLVPGYSATRGLGWLEQGNFYVQPNLRGGGEFGPAWHESVIRMNRPLIYQDHQAVLKDVLSRGYASSIFVRGGSNGGLLTSVALTSYPELIQGAVVQVPLTDMLRYHQWSAGSSWIAEYGDPSDPQEREVLESYSPLHNIREHSEVSYPPALVTTSTRDDRVHPAHARLFAAALADCGQPVDYYENVESGHAGAADNEQVAFMEALIFTWLQKHADQASPSRSIFTEEGSHHD
ncbi:prolyl oligopeptidase [Corynebacterium pseudotuberculosis]|uniref:prolyl oligopeptidase family serine peptidase n=1 Tax=Corynebacterium pseudotuberculosis TaxID=1719 RepID=UPI000737CDE6|nr:prolyl oligopeptidase family serine peptidase [Corynebacterium pseudotuberculosis]ALU20838.1 prolyl oligopeptidase [Corynebacterium pseudotuberculosis]ANH23020.1 Serine proteases of the peptidase family S9A [Corynebacterium pseudotuberculosis]